MRSITTNEGEAKPIAALGAEKVFVVKTPGAWPEGLPKSLPTLVTPTGERAAGGGTLRGKDIAAKVAHY